MPAANDAEEKVRQLRDHARFILHGEHGLETGGGGGDCTGMDSRVTRIEEWAKLSDQRMGRVEDKLDTIIHRLGALPSRTDLIVYALTGLGVALAVVAAIVGGIAILK